MYFHVSIDSIVLIDSNVEYHPGTLIQVYGVEGIILRNNVFAYLVEFPSKNHMEGEGKLLVSSYLSVIF